MSETEIIQKLQQGNEQAFKQLVENYQKLVVNTCFGMVHNTEDAEDIAQEVFIEVFRSIHKFRDWRVRREFISFIFLFSV